MAAMSSARRSLHAARLPTIKFIAIMAITVGWLVGS